MSYVCAIVPAVYGTLLVYPIAL